MLNTDITSTNNQMKSSIRPISFNEYIGQEKIKNNLKVAILAAKKRNEPLDHVLLYGSPGLGKTTLSNIISYEMESDIQITSGPAIEKTGDLASILMNLKEKDILFIDEIHRLSTQVEEFLYSAMEDYQISITIGQGEQLRAITIDLPKFTLIGATTRAGMLSSPLRDRFGHIHRMEYYTDNELSEIIRLTSLKLQLELNEASCLSIAKASRGTPRIANNIVKRVRDFANIKYPDINNHIEDVLIQLNIQTNGLNDLDQRYIKLLKEQFMNKPTGIKTLSAALGEDEETLESVCEPYLIQKGILVRTPKGRILTEQYAS